MSIVKLEPGYRDYLWGGHKLVDEFHKNYAGDMLAETWELSCYPDNPSKIASGEEKGRTLPDYIGKLGSQILGTNCRKFEDFPILIKFIDAKKPLSIQVHPDNKYAMEHEGEYGKTEMWYIVDAEPGAFLYYGFEHEIAGNEFEERIKNNTLEEVLHKAYVKKGETYFIPSGTLHAIGKGITIAEIQQNSNITYRIYDYGRIDKNGKPRELHIAKALDVTKREPVKDIPSADPHIGICDYFSVDKIYLDGENYKTISGVVDEKSFLHVLFCEGEGEIECGGERLHFEKGDGFFIGADSGVYSITGKCEALVTRIP